MFKKFRFTLRTRINLLMLIFLVLFLQVSYFAVKKAGDALIIRNKTGDLRAMGLALADIFEMKNMTECFEEADEIYESIPEEVKNDPNITDFTDYYKDFRVDYGAEDGLNVQELIKAVATEQEMHEICICLVDWINERIVVIFDSEENPAGYCEKYEMTLLNESLYNGEYFASKEDDGRMMIGAYAPIINSEGKIVAFVHMLDYADDVDRSISAIVWIMGMILGVFFIILWIYLYNMIGRTVVKPIKRLSKAANNYINEENKNDDTTYFADLKIKSDDEIKDLATAMEDMEDSIHSYIADIRMAVAERQRLDTELEVAARIQVDMLPEKLQSDRFEISSLMRPARVVGGDFYDYFRIDDDRVAMIIADVSDKGVPASLFMVISKTVIKMCILENPDDLGAAVEKANRLLCEANKEMMFVTAYIGIYSASEGVLTYVNAGHERPLLYSGGAYSIIDMNHDLFLAAYEDETFEVRTLHLERGDRLLLYTDGVTEAMDTSDNLLGESGLLKALESQTELHGKEIINFIWDTVSSFQKGKEQSDDVTILLFEV